MTQEREGGREGARGREGGRVEGGGWGGGYLANVSNEHGDGKDAVVGVFLGEKGQDGESHGEGLGAAHEHKRLVERQRERQSHAQPVINGQKEHVHDRSPHQTHDRIPHLHLTHPWAQSQRYWQGVGWQGVGWQSGVPWWLRGHAPLRLRTRGSPKGLWCSQARASMRSMQVEGTPGAGRGPSHTCAQLTPECFA